LKETALGRGTNDSIAEGSVPWFLGKSSWDKVKQREKRQRDVIEKWKDVTGRE
jgi:hypothetical protein